MLSMAFSSQQGWENLNLWVPERQITKPNVTNRTKSNRMEVILPNTSLLLNSLRQKKNDLMK